MQCNLNFDRNFEEINITDVLFFGISDTSAAVLYDKGIHFAAFYEDISNSFYVISYVLVY